MSGGHTPGPWMIEPYSDEDETLYVCANYDKTDQGFARATWIAECDLQDGNLAENTANAHLMAASPDLLAAARAAWHLCQSLLMVREGASDDLILSVGAALAQAIAKAEARPS